MHSDTVLCHSWTSRNAELQVAWSSTSQGFVLHGHVALNEHREHLGGKMWIDRGRTLLSEVGKRESNTWSACGHRKHSFI